MGVAPIDYPPPVDSAQAYVGAPTDPEDERIEVGVVIVGGGPAGPASGSRLGQPPGDDEAATEARVRDPADAAARRRRVAHRAARRGAGGADREGQDHRLAPALGRDDASV